MGSRPFATADPFLQLIVLFLLSFVTLTVFLLMAQGLIGYLWGINVFTQQSELQNYDEPYVVQINRLLLLFQHLGLFVVPSLLFAKLISTRWREALGFTAAGTKALVITAVLIFAALPAINSLAWINESMALPEFLRALEAAFKSMEESAARLTEALTSVTSLSDYFINIIAIAALPALGEEMLFRGLVLPILKRWTGRMHIAVWISAALFSAMHLQFYGFLPRLLLGVFLGYLFVYTRSIWAPILAHFINNSLALTVLFLVARGEVSADLDSFSPTALHLIVSLISMLVVVGGIWYLARIGKAKHAIIPLQQTEDSPSENDV